MKYTAHFCNKADMDLAATQAIELNLIEAYLETGPGQRQRLDASTHRALTQADPNRDDIVYEALKH